MNRELLTERLRAAAVEALCAEYGVGSLYELPAWRFDALCHGEAERVIEELEAERGEPLPGHGEVVERVPPGYVPVDAKGRVCGVAYTTAKRWRTRGKLGWVRLAGDIGAPQTWWCAADAERLKRLRKRIGSERFYSNT